MYLQSIFRTAALAGIICLISVISPIFASDESISVQLQRIHTDAEQKKLSDVSIKEMKADVINRLGEPSDTRHYGGMEELAWHYNSEGWKGKVPTRKNEWDFDIVRVYFKQGRVSSVEARLTKPFETFSEMDKLFHELGKLNPDKSLGGPGPFFLISEFEFNREVHNIYYLVSYQSRFAWITVAER